MQQKATQTRIIIAVKQRCQQQKKEENGVIEEVLGIAKNKKIVYMDGC